MTRIQVVLEQARMESEDTRQNGGESAAHRLSHHFTTVDPEPNQLFSRDLHSEAAARDPAMYGPYIAEGGSYKTPRTPENVAAACKAMGLDDLPEKDSGERKVYVYLVYELEFCLMASCALSPASRSISTSVTPSRVELIHTDGVRPRCSS